MSSLLIAYIVLSGLGTVLNLVPFVWQIRHGNSGPSCLILWTILGNVNNFVNAIVWRQGASVAGSSGWCDISVKLKIGGVVGNAASALCIVRFLALVISPSATVLTPKDITKRKIFDYGLSFGLPLLAMAMHVVFQPTRYAVSQITGCIGTAVHTWPFYFVYVLWIPLLFFAAAITSMYVILRLIQHRRDFHRLVANSQSALNTSRFLRLLALSILFLAINLPLSILWVQATIAGAGDYKDYDWDYIHAHFDYIITYPDWNDIGLVQFSYVIASSIVVLFFGFSSEALAYYGNITKALGLAPLVSAAQRFITARKDEKSSSAFALKSFQSTSRGGRFVSSLPMGRSSSEGSDNKSYKGPFSGQETETDEVKPPPGLGTGVTVFRQQEIA